MQGAVFSKVLKYDDEYSGLIGTDLAETVPEVVDKNTYVIKIRPNVFFHDTERIRSQFPQVAGRQLTAEDVRYSIDRQRNKQSPKSALFYRGYQWEAVDKISKPDPLNDHHHQGPWLPSSTTWPTPMPSSPRARGPAKDEMNDSAKMIGGVPSFWTSLSPSRS
jgi:ABC-type transport system substrate-binding protein